MCKSQISGGFQTRCHEPSAPSASNASSPAKSGCSVVYEAGCVWKNAGTEDMVKFMKHLGKTGQECIRMPWKLRWMMVNASFKSMQRDSSWLFPFVSSIFFDARDVKVQASQVRSAVRVAVVPCGIVEGFRFPWTPNPACLGSDVGCGG